MIYFWIYFWLLRKYDCLHQRKNAKNNQNLKTQFLAKILKNRLQTKTSKIQKFAHFILDLFTKI